MTNARLTGYDVILSAPELTIHECSRVNPSEHMVTPTVGSSHLETKIGYAVVYTTHMSLRVHS